MNKAPKLSKVVWYKSLGFYILFWFLLISLVPLLVLSYESNKISVEALKEAEFKDLKHSAALKTKFIDNWFYYRKIDISNWSQTKANIDFLSLLISEYKKSLKEPNEFVESYRYIETITQYQDQL
jgi:two-component system, sensor histidine kinase and response regulator